MSDATAPNLPEIDPASAIPPAELDQITEGLVAALKTDMTLTAPGCPVAGEMPGWVETAAAAVPGVAGAKVSMVFDPPWDQSRMSDEARVALDMW